MKRLFSSANRYVKESDWKDLALIKICLCAMGMIIGLCIPKEKKKIPFIVAVSVFWATYIPLMVKFIRVFAQEGNDSCEE